MTDSKPAEADWQTARRIKKANEDRLLALPGVVGVDVGRKIVGGEKTEIVAIRVYVEKKLEIGGESPIPETIEGVPTDIIERRFRLH